MTFSASSGLCGELFFLFGDTLQDSGEAEVHQCSNGARISAMIDSLFRTIDNGSVNMHLSFEMGLAATYSSGLQRARVLTEPWVANQVYCPNCGYFPLVRYPNNSAIGDFYCSDCRENCELKSKRTHFGAKVDDGAYKAMLQRLGGNANPNLFLLNYDVDSLSVTNLVIIPKHFFIPQMIEERRPLSPTARRKGWVGCRILLRAVPSSGQIAIIRNGAVMPKAAVLDRWQRTLFLREQRSLEAKSWLVDVMRCIERIGKHRFTIDEVYAFEAQLQLAYPNNRHIRAKIRQRMQVLRDSGYIAFMGGGTYKLADTPD